MPARSHEYEPGSQHGCWTVVREVEPVKKSWGLQRMVHARCRCGFEDDVLPKMLVRGGAYCRKCNPGRKREITYSPGDRFGNWTVVREVEGAKTPGGWSIRRILAACICGTEYTITRGQLHKSNTCHLVARSVQSCGCRRHRSGVLNPQWTGVGRLSGSKWSSYKSGARHRGIAFNITKEEAWAKYEAQAGCCALTNWPIDFHIREGTETTASLDRIDSSKGYTLDNVQWVHKDVNRMKQSFSEERLLELCRAVVGHHQ